MTATTLPAVDLEQLVDGEVERQCEGWWQYEDNRCQATADWLVAWAKPCPCRAERHAFLCDDHKELIANDAAGFHCDYCQAPVTFTLFERVRSPR